MQCRGQFGGRGGGKTDAVREAERRRRAQQEVELVRHRMNKRALEFCKKLLPNGRQAGHYWETSNIEDRKTGSYSLKVDLRRGSWTDFGKAKGQPGASGDMLSLYVEREHGGDFAKAIIEAKQLCQVANLDDSQFARAQAESARQAEQQEIAEDEERKAKLSSAQRLWNGAAPIAGEEGLTPGHGYLAGRGIDFHRLGRVPGSLRYHPACWNREIADRLGKAHAKIPALIACVMGLDGQLRGVHRTFLDVSAGKGGPVRKAAVNDPKLTLGPSLGGHIPLWKGEFRGPLRAIPPGTDVYMSEGIEDGLSLAVARPGLRIIAGVSLSKMGAVELPEQMGALVIIGQNDTKAEPIEALHRAIQAQQERGHKVRTIYPPEDYKDFNDMLCGKVRGNA